VEERPALSRGSSPPLASNRIKSYLYRMSEPGFHSKNEGKGQDRMSFGPDGHSRSAHFFKKAPIVLLLVFAALLYVVAQLASEQ
jgi:hypothetical protein